MVTPGPVAKLASRLWRALRDDVAGLAAALGPDAMVRPGLYTYRVQPGRGSRRIHLRIEEDGSGLVLVDVTDVVHLNATAAGVAKLALEGVPRPQIIHRMWRRAGGDSRRLVEHVDAVCRLIEHLRTTSDTCTTCGLAGVSWAPPFSTAVRAPYKADLALSYGCNNACRHCYNPPQRTCMPSLGLREWQRVLRKLADIGIPHVIFTGGEPTLFAGLAELIATADSLGLVTGVNTNGRRLADRRFAQSLADASLGHVQITLESCDATVHDAMTGAASFGETVQGIRNALAVGLHTITNTTLTQRNADPPEPLVDFLFELGLRTMAVNGMIYSGCGRETEDALEERALAALLVRINRRAAERDMRLLWYTPTAYCRLSPLELGLGPRRCNAGEYSLCIEPNGDVLPCQSFYEPAGNLLADPWESIWNSRLFRSFRDRTEQPEACGLPRECWDCPELEVCGSGCRIERESREARAAGELANLTRSEVNR